MKYWSNEVLLFFFFFFFFFFFLGFTLFLFSLFCFLFFVFVFLEWFSSIVPPEESFFCKFFISLKKKKRDGKKRKTGVSEKGLKGWVCLVTRGIFCSFSWYKGSYDSMTGNKREFWQRKPHLNDSFICNHQLSPLFICLLFFLFFFFSPTLNISPFFGILSCDSWLLKQHKRAAQLPHTPRRQKRVETERNNKSKHVRCVWKKNKTKQNKTKQSKRLCHFFVFFFLDPDRGPNYLWEGPDTSPSKFSRKSRGIAFLRKIPKRILGGLNAITNQRKSNWVCPFNWKVKTETNPKGLVCTIFLFFFLFLWIFLRSFEKISLFFLLCYFEHN